LKAQNFRADLKCLENITQINIKKMHTFIEKSYILMK